jgi:hypothetical protein
LACEFYAYVNLSPNLVHLACEFYAYDFMLPQTGDKVGDVVVGSVMAFGLEYRAEDAYSKAGYSKQAAREMGDNPMGNPVGQQLQADEGRVRGACRAASERAEQAGKAMDDMAANRRGAQFWGQQFSQYADDLKLKKPNQ